MRRGARVAEAEQLAHHVELDVGDVDAVVLALLHLVLEHGREHRRARRQDRCTQSNMQVQVQVQLQVRVQYTRASERRQSVV